MKLKNLCLALAASFVFVVPAAFADDPVPQQAPENAAANTANVDNKTDGAEKRSHREGKKTPNPHRRSTYTVQSRNFKPEISRGLRPENVKQVLRDHRPDIEACYKQEIVKSPVIQGKVGMHVLIDTKGGVIKVFVKESSLGSYDLAHCLAENIKTWQFAETKDGGMRQFKHWFVFENGEYIENSRLRQLFCSITPNKAFPCICTLI